MGELIPLFSHADIQFKLSPVQRLRFEGLRDELRFKKVEHVAAVIFSLLLAYFEKKREGWILVMVWGDRVAEVKFESSRRSTPKRGLLRLALVSIVIILERLVRGLRRFANFRSSRSPESEVYLLKGKEYRIRCSRKVFRAVHKIQGYYLETGSSVTIDEIMIQGVGFLEYLLKEHRKKPVRLIYQKTEEKQGLDLCWEEYMDRFR